ncbi:hypothetical protein [Brevundimonas sp.]|uniref:hypothetical protein n=1 Tax=Brevundimonas sp. TaxID=1871086 RepID=UPI0025D8995C|nr:hypothetical protein [Brevundimonas sp.]
MRRPAAARRPSAVRVVGPLQWIVYPSLAAIALTVVLATPIEMFGLTLPEPVVPLVLAFAWPLIRPSILAPVMLLVLGLFLDLFRGSPLGLWPLALLAPYGLVLLSRPYIAGQDTRLLFGWYVGACLLAFAMAYLVVTISFGMPPSLISLFWQIVPTVLLFPLANIMLERFDDGDLRFR